MNFANLRKALSILLGLIILSAVVALTIGLGRILWITYDALDKTVQVGIATALSVIVVAVISYFANKAVETRKSVELAIRPRKLELYEGFIDFFLRVMGKEGVVTKPSEDEIMQFFVKSNPLIVTFASNAVIEKWGKLRISMSDGDSNNLFRLEDLLKEIRKDLGHTKVDSKKGDILRLFVNDVDSYLKK